MQSAYFLSWKKKHYFALLRNLTLVSWDRSLCEGLLITVNEFFCGHGVKKELKVYYNQL